PAASRHFSPVEPKTACPVRRGLPVVSAAAWMASWWASWSLRVRGEATLVLLARLANVGAGTVLVLLTARHLGPSGRGEVVLAFTIAWGTTNVADLGTSTSGRINLLMPGSSVTPRNVLSLTGVLIPVQALLATVVVALLSLTSLPIGFGFGVAVVALSVATMMFNSTVSLVSGLRRYGDVLVAEATVAMFQIVVLAGLLWADRLTPTSAVLAMTVGPAFGAIQLVKVSGAWDRRRSVQDVSPWRTLIRDGLSPMAGSISFFIALRLGRMVLAVAAGTRSLGLFAVALAVPETLRILPKAVGQVVADRGRSGIDSVATARRHTRLFMVGHGVVLAVAAAVGWVLVPVVFGEGFTGARDVLVVVTAAEAVLAVHFMHQALLVGFARPKGIGVPEVVGAVVMVVLT
ncbi:uncharacterized protein METZ01_LOCUS287045, partial [marine metagenome]